MSKALIVTPHGAFTLAGRLIKDVEVKQVGEKQWKKATLAIAVGDKKEGDDEIINVIAKFALAEYAGELRKGDNVAVIGTKEKPREYNGKTYQDYTASWLCKQPTAQCGDLRGEPTPPPKDPPYMQEIDESMPF